MYMTLRVVPMIPQSWDGSPEILRKVVVPVVGAEECSAIYEVIGGVSEGSICAGLEEGGKDSCQVKSSA